MQQNVQFILYLLCLQMTHISQLPAELVLLVLRWIVSADLDLKSLQSCSNVSRGFYLAARDNEIWKLICARYAIIVL
jgi:F-box protein 9